MAEEIHLRWMKFAIRRADTTNDAIYRKRYAHVIKSALRQEMEADLISSEVAHRRFHPSSLGFHPAKQDFIKFIRLAGIVFVLASFFVFSSSEKPVNKLTANNDEKTKKVVLIVCIAVGSVAVVATVATIVIMVNKRKRRRQN